MRHLLSDPAGSARLPQRARDHEEIPLGSVVKTPLGLLARVEAYRGYGDREGAERAHRVYLVCRYLQPANKRYDIVQLVPELLTVVEYGTGVLPGRGTRTPGTVEPIVKEVP